MVEVIFRFQVIDNTQRAFKCPSKVQIKIGIFSDIDDETSGHQRKLGNPISPLNKYEGMKFKPSRLRARKRIMAYGASKRNRSQGVTKADLKARERPFRTQLSECWHFLNQTVEERHLIPRGFVT